MHKYGRPSFITFSSRWVILFSSSFTFHYVLYFHDVVTQNNYKYFRFLISPLILRFYKLFSFFSQILWQDKTCLSSTWYLFSKNYNIFHQFFIFSKKKLEIINFPTRNTHFQSIFATIFLCFKLQNISTFSSKNRRKLHSFECHLLYLNLSN
jgi:hypothetical protein